MKVARVITEKNNIEGTIYEAGFDEKSHFNYLYEPEKKILHIYDDRSYSSTSAVNSVNEIVAEIDKIITGESKGLSKLTQNFISLFSKSDPVKIIIYTEAGALGGSGTNNFGDPLRIQAYDLQNKDYTGYTKDELHPNFAYIHSVVESN
ncbi:hypothetical protein [Bacillus pumilus]|uniref:hypothetical protein n=1 Tax=Bacillus pumilus TaxID=1408 RepID=UPI0011A75ADE|nr:hypothetical protein [Bacillus pumilus]